MPHGRRGIMGVRRDFDVSYIFSFSKEARRAKSPFISGMFQLSATVGRIFNKLFGLLDRHITKNT